MPLKRQRIILFFALALSMTGALPCGSHATTVLHKEVNELAREADTIILGKVLRTFVEEQNGMPYTYHILSVEKNLGGLQLAQRCVVAIPGGISAGRGTRVHGLRALMPDERVVLFLEARPEFSAMQLGSTEKIFAIAGFGQGHFQVLTNRTTGSDVVMAATGVATASSGFKLQVQANNGTSLDNFISTVTQARKGP